MPTRSRRRAPTTTPCWRHTGDAWRSGPGHGSPTGGGGGGGRAGGGTGRAVRPRRLTVQPTTRQGTLTLGDRQGYLDGMGNPRTAVPGASGTETLCCSFCTKDKDAVAKLIAGPGVYICDECVNLCDLILAEEQVRLRLMERTARRRAAGQPGPGSGRGLTGRCRRARAGGHLARAGRELDQHRAGARRVEAGGLGAVLRRGLTAAAAGVSRSQGLRDIGIPRPSRPVDGGVAAASRSSGTALPGR